MVAGVGIGVRRALARRWLVLPSPDARVALGFSLAILVYGNSVSLLSDEFRDRYLIWINLGFLGLLALWAWLGPRLSLREAGLDPQVLVRGAGIGVALSVVAAIPPVAFIALAPLFNGGPVEAEQITQRSGASLAYFLLFRQPVGTSFFEELAFRGLLYGAWQRVGGHRIAILATAVTFGFWHVVITSKTVAGSGVVSQPPMVAAGVVVSILGLFVGGLLFAFLRWRTGGIAAATVAHWLLVSFMTITVWAVGR